MPIHRTRATFGRPPDTRLFSRGIYYYLGAEFIYRYPLITGVMLCIVESLDLLGRHSSESKPGGVGRLIEI